MDITQQCKPYDPPAVIYEVELEVRAGSPIGIPNPMDLFGTGD